MFQVRRPIYPCLPDGLTRTDGADVTETVPVMSIGYLTHRQYHGLNRERCKNVETCYLLAIKTSLLQPQNARFK